MSPPLADTPRLVWWTPSSDSQVLGSPHGPFPLTLTLSLRERGQRSPTFGDSRRDRLAEALANTLPLPKGEGWGEGEQAARPPRLRDGTDPTCLCTNRSSLVS